MASHLKVITSLNSLLLTVVYFAKLKGIQKMIDNSSHEV